MKKLLHICAITALASTLQSGTAATASATHWTWTGWGGGGFFWSAQFDPHAPDTLYMTGDVCGIYKSTDRATTWRMINTGIQNYAVYAVAVSPADSATLYVMTTDGMARSDDAGETWTPLAETRNAAKRISVTRGASVRPIAIDPKNADVVYAGSGKGKLFKSVNRGETWRELNYSPDASSGAIASVVIDPNDSQHLFVAHRKLGLFRSVDGGAAWQSLETAPAAHVAFYPGDARIVYAALGTSGVWKSVDKGATWQSLPGSLPANADAREIAVDPRDPDVIHVIARQSWNGYYCVSRDGGATWQSQRFFARDALSNPSLPPARNTWQRKDLSAPASLALNPSAPDSIFIAGNRNNVFSRDAGATWVERNAGAEISCVYDVRFAGDSVFVVAMDQGLNRSDDNGATWRNLTPGKHTDGLSGHQWRVAVHGDRIVATFSPWRAGNREFPNGVLVSDDGGKTFARAKGLPDTLPKTNTMWEQGFGRALAVDPQNPDVMYLGIDGNDGGGIFKSTDGGRNWARLAGQPGSRRMFFGLAVDPNDSDKLYWGACGDNSGVWVSADGGATWHHTNLREWIYNVEAAPSGNAIYAGGKNLWQSRDAGKTWQCLTKLEGRTVVGIAVDPEDENRIWISAVTWGTNAAGDILHSADGGKTWHTISGDIPYRKPLVLRYNAKTRELWAAGVGIYKTKQ